MAILNYWTTTDQMVAGFSLNNRPNRRRNIRKDEKTFADFILGWTNLSRV